MKDLCIYELMMILMMSNNTGIIVSYAYDRPGKHHHHPTPKQNNQ